MSKLRAARFLSAFFIVSVCVSCVTETSGHDFVSYSDERSILYEVNQTRKLIEKEPLKALARAWALTANTSGYEQVATLFADAEKRSAAEFSIAVESSNWNDALRLFSSLDTMGMTPGGWTFASLKQERLRSWAEEGNRTLAELDSLPRSTPEDDAPSSVIVSSMIKGTVTVWVDRGLRVENGVGYADRVIGSAFFIDDRGYLITNYHVIQSEVDPKYEGYSRLFIKLADDPDTRIPAKVIGWDSALDLALIKTEIKPPAVFQLGSSKDLQVGNRIYAIGSPAGLEQTLTSGIVSAQNRRLLSVGDVLQIDAPINHGNSGGPIVDEAGRVQAVVFAGIEPYEGLNFAIPVEYLRIILPDLYAGGSVQHSWLGSYGKTATLKGQNVPGGVSLVYTIPGSSCSVAGIPEGAIITAVNGKATPTIEILQSILVRESSGTIIKLTGIVSQNDDGTQTVRDWFVLLESRPEYPGLVALETDIQSRVFLPLFGFSLEQVGSTKKYLVKSVLRGSSADESGFMELDVIEIRDVDLQADKGIVQAQLFTKRRKSGYMESYIGLGAYLDSPSYF